MKSKGRSTNTKNANESKLLFFEELFHDSYDLLLAYAFKKVNDKQAAEDVVQDVFLSLWMKKDVLDFSESIKPYLYKAVYNRSITYLTSLPHKVEVDKCSVDLLLHKEIVSYNQQDSLLLKEISGAINSYVETLPDQCRKVFRLSREENLKNREIAQTLNISIKTVEDHIRRALRGLYEYLRQSGFLSLLF
ncbi:RNA polymerase sigma-70 factor [Parabacteroides sp. PFB2-10]|uniref:RNA polymerase sigma-70 factor n=1 Tax=Parabacteroides sp. PFB2-10 TaxID=1742405 RepID=UPI0024752DDA|nr:RNA polymerase sigma-70 factor [Parabacteroides sp. PFB2-10]